MHDTEKISGMSWRRVARRFRVPLLTATGDYAVRESLVVRLTDAAGRAGYGEVAPWPGFPVETPDAAEAQLRKRKSSGEGYASPPCFLHELAEVGPGRGDPSCPTPCLDAALSHARAWLAGDWGRANFAFPCAGLLRAPADIPEALRRRDSGYTVLKTKIGRASLRDEQREVAALIRALGSGVSLRLDANGALSGDACSAWCDFLSEYPEVAWLEQPLRPGEEARMRDIAERAGVADRLALDESACTATILPADWPGVFAVKPPLLGDLDAWRKTRAKLPPERLAYSSVFETPFGRQAALCVAGESPDSGYAVGFDTLGAFDDDLDAHAAGQRVSTLSRDADFWEDLWQRL